MLGKLPHRLRRVREERGFGAQQPLVPRERALVVAHRKPHEEVDRHACRTPSAWGAPRRTVHVVPLGTDRADAVTLMLRARVLTMSLGRRMGHSGDPVGIA